MTDWSKILPCKKCGTKPQVKVTLEWISLTCPICEKKSITHITHGLDVTINDWNKYHGSID